MPNPQSARLSGDIRWSDNSPFNGFGVIGLVLPTAGGINWPELTIEPNAPKQRLPLWSTIPIKAGIFNQALGLWFTNDISPPNTKYAIWYYDTSGKMVGMPTDASDFFTVTLNPTTPPVYTLTVPSVGTEIPNPGELGITMSLVDTVDEIPGGVVNGVNASFVLSRPPVPPNSLKLWVDGVLMTQTTHYTVSGINITFVSAFKPITGQTIFASYRYIR